MMARSLWVWLLALAASASSACFNSAWFQEEATQRQRAQQETPRALQATAPAASNGIPEPSRRSVRVLRVRACVTSQYAAEVMDWQRQFAGLLDDANRIFEPTIGIRLQMADTRTWRITATDSLESLLDQLSNAEPGDGVDWVVGLLGSPPTFELAYHKLGIGRLLGKHLLLRSINDAREREAMQVELSRLSEREREDLWQTRKRHKTTAVLLHEFGHTLGLVHEMDPSSIMNMRYDKTVSAFSPDSVEIMRLTIEHRQAHGEDDHAYAEALVTAIERSKTNWVPADRDELLAIVREWQQSPGAAAPAAAPTVELSAAELESLKDVGDDDRALYSRALASERAGHAQEAWTTGEPLFSRYTEVYVIQDLRCRLAMQLSNVFKVTRRECDQLMRLTVPKPATPTRK